MDIVESNKTTKRKAYIDGLRGLAMIVVVFGHSLLRNENVNYAPYFVFSSPFNVALFFTITGYLFSTRGGQILPFLKHVFLRLIVPWLVLGLFPYYNIVKNLPRLLSGELFWFMPALVVAEIIFFFIQKYLKEYNKIVVCGLLFSAIGLVLYRVDWLNYAMVNRAMTIQWLFVLGIIIRNHEDAIVEFVKKKIVICLMLFIILCIMFMLIYPNEFYDLHYNRYYFIPLTWSLIIIGVSVIFSIFKNIKRIPNWLVLVGQNTLIIYLFHGRIVHYLRILLPSSIIQTCTFYPVYAAFETVVACVVCLSLGLLANKYIPEIVGQKRMNHERK